MPNYFFFNFQHLLTNFSLTFIWRDLLDSWGLQQCHWHVLYVSLQFLKTCFLNVQMYLISVAQSVNGANEIGRIFAVTSFLSALLPFISNPSYRFLFDSTALSFPEAILVMAGCLLTVSVILNIFLYIRRNKILGGIWRVNLHFLTFCCSLFFIIDFKRGFG